MIRTLGLAIAFSPTAERMLAEAVALTRRFSARLVLIHVGDHGEKQDQQLRELLAGHGLAVRIRFQCEIFNEANTLIHRGETLLAFVNQKTGRPCRPPAAFEEVLAPYF